MRSTLRAIWFLVPDPLSVATLKLEFDAPLVSTRSGQNRPPPVNSRPDGLSMKLLSMPKQALRSKED